MNSYLAEEAATKGSALEVASSASRQTAAGMHCEHCPQVGMQPHFVQEDQSQQRRYSADADEKLHMRFQRPARPIDLLLELEEHITAKYKRQEYEAEVTQCSR